MGVGVGASDTPSLSSSSSSSSPPDSSDSSSVVAITGTFEILAIAVLGKVWDSLKPFLAISSCELNGALRDSRVAALVGEFMVVAGCLAISVFSSTSLELAVVVAVAGSVAIAFTLVLEVDNGFLIGLVGLTFFGFYYAKDLKSFISFGKTQVRGKKSNSRG